MENQPISSDQLPVEFDIIKTGKGYTMRGWDFTREELAAAINAHRMLNPAMELGTNYCPWNCSFCFTEEPGNLEGEKRRLANEMSPERKLALIDEAAALGAKTINFIGAGEPTIDPHFWILIERMQSRSITPVVCSEGALRLTDEKFARRLYETGATVIVKANSLWNAGYQNAIVAGAANDKRPNSGNYTQLRNRAIATLLETGFANHDPTRLVFNTIVCQQNAGEIMHLHRWARDRNIFVLFVDYLPSGRSSSRPRDALSREEQTALFRKLAEIDATEYGIRHDSRFPYAGGTPCSIRGLGLFVKIDGRVFDCTGESVELGDLRTETLASIWERARPITRALDGGCYPREKSWTEPAETALDGMRRLPIVA